jgi:hypothetical protein
MLPGLLFGMDNYYEPFKKLAHRLREEDIGKKCKKVVPAIVCDGSGRPDYSYTDEVYILVSISYFESKDIKSPERQMKRVVLKRSKCSGEEIIDCEKLAANKRYFEGWVTLDETKNIQPDTTQSLSHIDQMRRWAKGRE